MTASGRSLKHLNLLAQLEESRYVADIADRVPIRHPATIFRAQGTPIKPNPPKGGGEKSGFINSTIEADEELVSLALLDVLTKED